MKFVIAAVFLIFAISQVSSLEQNNLLEEWKALQIKMIKLDFNDAESQVFANHLVQYNKNYENVTRPQAAKYLGCYKDHIQQRMFRGYAQVSKTDNSVEGCIDLCRRYLFTYAGVQIGTECFCGDSSPQPSYNARLPEGNCNSKCSGNNGQICGGSWAMSVYTTGFLVTRQDLNGNVVGESSMYSALYWERQKT